MPEPQSSPFLELLTNAEDGVLVHDLNASLRTLVRALKTQFQNRGGTPKGQLQLTVAFA
jgi:hypothetical protein